MDVICFSDINWDFLWQRHQQLLTRFPKTWNILFIEPSFLGTFKDKPHHILPRKVEENIFVTSFPMIPVFDRNQMLRSINDLLIIFWTRFAARVFHISNPIIIIYEPRYACTLGKIGELLSCYEIADDRLEFTQVPRWIEQKIDLLIKKSDLITLSANNLFVKINKKRKNDLHIVGNGVDLEFFKKGGVIFPRPSDIPKINNPIVGYIGAIGEWFDFNLIEMVLQSCSDLFFIIIGPIFPEQMMIASKLEKNYSNIKFLGKKDYHILPQYINTFDVCLIPFKVNELTKGVNPVKVYEYAASGKPVVSTYLPELEKYQDTIYLAKDYKEFVEFIYTSIDEKPDVEKLLAMAEENTWDSQTNKMLNLFNQYISMKTKIE